MKIRIGTRKSNLAIWQANKVKDSLSKINIDSELILINSTGDLSNTKPIYSLGVTGVFTKELDIALLDKKIDIAVHSLKDVPTELAKNIQLSSVIKRGFFEDIAFIKNKNFNNPCNIATSSLRRGAQWLEKYPHHNITPIRGNVETRINKFYDNNNLDVLILAKAGVHRLGIMDKNVTDISWMIPAPAQGIVGITNHEDNSETREIINKINHKNSFLSAKIERDFMNKMLGGCSAPVSCITNINEDKISFKGALHSLDGKSSYKIEKKISIHYSENLGTICAAELRENSSVIDLINSLKKDISK